MGAALQTAGGLALVIALIFGAAWMLRGSQRFGLRGNPLLRVIASQPLSTRERVVVVELGETWLVLGVAPGQVSRLARLTRPAGVSTGLNADGSGLGAAPVEAFQTWLARALQRK